MCNNCIILNNNTKHFSLYIKMDIRKLSSKKFDKYDKKCNVIKNLILKDYANDKFEFIRNPETLHIEIIINNNSKITILRNNSYEDIKRHIEKKLQFNMMVFLKIV